jgi:hypothetical protein
LLAAEHSSVDLISGFAKKPDFQCTSQRILLARLPKEPEKFFRKLLS